MAKAIKIEKKVEPPPFEVELTLTQDEALTVFRICGHLLGDGKLRRHADRIYEAMEPQIFRAGEHADPFIGNATLITE